MFNFNPDYSYDPFGYLKAKQNQKGYTPGQIARYPYLDNPSQTSVLGGENGEKSQNPYLSSAQVAMMAAAPMAGAIAGQDTNPRIIGSPPNLPSSGAYGSDFNYKPQNPYGNRDAMYRSLLARYLMQR